MCILKHRRLYEREREMRERQRFMDSSKEAEYWYYIMEQSSHLSRRLATVEPRYTGGGSEDDSESRVGDKDEVQAGALPPTPVPPTPVPPPSRVAPTDEGKE